MSGAYLDKKGRPSWFQLGRDIDALEKTIKIAVEEADANKRMFAVQEIFKRVHENPLFMTAAQRRVEGGLTNGWGKNPVVWGRGAALGQRLWDIAAGRPVSMPTNG